MLDIVITIVLCKNILFYNRTSSCRSYYNKDYFIFKKQCYNVFEKERFGNVADGTRLFFPDFAFYYDSLSVKNVCNVKICEAKVTLKRIKVRIIK